MAFSDLIAKAQTYFPNLQVKYKDQSTLMKVLGKILFFNPTFMTQYVTTLGNTVYLPNEQYPTQYPEDAVTVFIHECTHMYDEQRLGKIPYTLGYMFPQLLFVLMWPLLFLVSWKIVLPLSLLFLAPLPAPWRAYFEQRAYFVQMLVNNKIYGEDPDNDGNLFAGWFRNGNYYFMWPFEQTSVWLQEAANIKAGKGLAQTEAGLSTMVNDLITAAQK